MTPNHHLHTPRLDLIPATLEILKADRDKDKQTLARLLNAAVPGAWPPPLLDDEALDYFIRTVSEGTDPLFISWYWVLDDPAEGGERTLIGSGGIASASTAGDTVLIGYSVLDEFQRRGYATEAVHHLIPAIFALGVRRIMATTYPELVASIRVLEKNGFVRAGDADVEALTGEGIEEGAVAYVLKKPKCPDLPG